MQLQETTEQRICIAAPPEYKRSMRIVIVEIDGNEIVGEKLTKTLYARQICSVYNSVKAAVLEELLE